MRGHRIEWDEAWIVANFHASPSLQELNRKYNETHGTKICYRTFRGFCQRRGLKKCNLTEEQDAFIRNNYATMGGKMLTEAFNKAFNTNKSYKQIRALVNNRKLTIADESLYKDCRINKRGIKYEVGDVTQGWCEPYVKVGKDKFVKASRYVYEKVVHLDGDLNNYGIENLQAIPNSYNAIMMRNGLWSHNPTLTKGALMLCELREKINQVQIRG